MNVGNRLGDLTNVLLEKTLGMKLCRVPLSKHAYEDIAAMRRWSAEDVIFDVGANDGRSIDRIRRHMPSPAIYAFEPVAATFQTLTEHTRQMSNVQRFQLALAAEPGEATIYLHETSSLNSFDPDWESPVGSEVVKVSTVDVVMAELGLSHVHFLKIDTEGLELEVLRGASQALESRSVGIIQLETGFDRRVRASATLDEFQQVLAPYGYYLTGIYNQCHSRLGGETPHPRSIETGVLNYCDAVFAAV